MLWYTLLNIIKLESDVSTFGSVYMLTFMGVITVTVPIHIFVCPLGARRVVFSPPNGELAKPLAAVHSFEWLALA